MVLHAQVDFASQLITIISKIQHALFKHWLKGRDVLLASSHGELDPMEKREELLIMVTISNDCGQANNTCIWYVDTTSLIRYLMMWILLCVQTNNDAEKSSRDVFDLMLQIVSRFLSRLLPFFFPKSLVLLYN